jgi:hypothetical protein
VSTRGRIPHGLGRCSLALPALLTVGSVTSAQTVRAKDRHRPDAEASKGASIALAAGLAAPSGHDADTQRVGLGETLSLTMEGRIGRIWALGGVLEGGRYRFVVDRYPRPEQSTTLISMLFVARAYAVERSWIRVYLQGGVGPAQFVPSVDSRECGSVAPLSALTWQWLAGLEAPVSGDFWLGTQAGYAWAEGSMNCESTDLARGAPYRNPFFDPGTLIRIVGSYGGL